MTYRVNDPGWLRLALADAKAKRPFTVAIGAADVGKLISVAQHSADVVTQFPLLGLLHHLLPPGVLPDAIPEAVLLAIGGLAATGYTLGAESSVALVAGVAHGAGMTLKLALVVPPGDITAVELHIEAA